MFSKTFGTAPPLGVKTRLSSPLVAGAVLLLLGCLAALAITTLPGCNAGVHADSHPSNGTSTSSTPAPKDTSSKVTVTTETVLHPDGSSTVITTTCTCDGSTCKKDVKKVEIPPPVKPVGFVAPKTLVAPISPLFVDADLEAKPKPTEAPEPDYQLAIAESDPASTRRVTLSQKTDSLVVRADFTGLNRSDTIVKAKDIALTLGTLDLPLPKPGVVVYVVKAKVDGSSHVEASTNIPPGETPEDTRARLKRFIAASAGIFDQAAKKASGGVNYLHPSYSTTGPVTV